VLCVLVVVGVTVSLASRCGHHQVVLPLWPHQKCLCKETGCTSQLWWEPLQPSICCVHSARQQQHKMLPHNAAQVLQDSVAVSRGHLAEFDTHIRASRCEFSPKCDAVASSRNASTQKQHKWTLLRQRSSSLSVCHAIILQLQQAKMPWEWATWLHKLTHWVPFM